MEQSDYIPKPYGEFFDWQNILISMIVDNETDWNIPHAKVLELQGKQTVYVGLYNTANTPATKTKSANQAHEEGRKVFEKDVRSFVREFLINNSAISIQEKIDAGLNPHLDAASSRPAIDTTPITSFKSLGGGVLRLDNRVENDSSRPSIHKHADGLEMRYAIVDASAMNPGPGPNPNPPAQIPLPADCPFQHFSTKARFKLELGGSNAGKAVAVFTRWKNNTDPGKSGPYNTAPHFFIIA